MGSVHLSSLAGLAHSMFVFRLKFICLLLISCAVASYIYSGLAFQFGIAPVDRGLLQLWFMPLGTLILLSMLRSAPSFLTVVLVLSAALGSYFSLVKYSYPDCTFCVALAEEDPLGANSMILAQRILNQSASAAELGNVMQKVATAQEARKWLAAHPKVDQLLWTKQGRLVVEQRLRPPRTLSAALPETWLADPLANLLIVNSIPSYWLSQDAGGHTFLFLGRIWDPRASEVALKGAASIRGAWTGAAHLGFAYWRLGNQLLLRGLARSGVGVSELGCAIRAYKDALKFSRFIENPHLTIAIANNLAVAQIAQALYSGGRRDIKSALKFLKKTRKLRSKVTRSTDFLGDSVDSNIREVQQFAVQYKLFAAGSGRKGIARSEKRRRNSNGVRQRVGKKKFNSGQSQSNNQANRIRPIGKKAAGQGARQLPS